MNKIKIKCKVGQSIQYCIDEHLFDLQLAQFRLLVRVRRHKSWTDFFLFQLEEIKSREEELNLLRECINE